MFFKNRIAFIPPLAEAGVFCDDYDKPTGKDRERVCFSAHLPKTSQTHFASVTDPHASD